MSGGSEHSVGGEVQGAGRGDHYTHTESRRKKERVSRTVGRAAERSQGGEGRYVWGREHAWGTAVRGGARACTLSRGAASSASKITTTGREAAVGAVEQRSATTPRRRGARRAFGPAFWAGVSGQMTPMHEQRSATTPTRRRGARRASAGPAFWAGVSGQMTPMHVGHEDLMRGLP